MKKFLKHGKQMIAFLLAVILTATLLPTENLNNILPEKLPWIVKAADIVHSGTDGDLTWSIDSKGCLRISGSGDYKYHAWTGYSDKIKTAVVDVDNITSANWMFYNCSSLTSLDLTSFNTGNVKDMGGMFWGCSSLTSLDLTSFNTGNVTSMSSMFYNCSSLTSLDLTSFNTGNVTD
ncbi:MAG: BspA family leucine-rich repeat surface protein, partial [Lachnospiraceae bacterium]|nr:BspA family leucine-rich repeat surface protein [Lachnospiraceae bacterium]